MPTPAAGSKTSPFNAPILDRTVGSQTGRSCSFYALFRIYRRSTNRKGGNGGLEKLSLRLFYDVFEQLYAGPFRTPVLQMLAGSHELIHALSVDKNLFTTSSRHRFLLDEGAEKGRDWQTLSCNMPARQHWDALLIFVAGVFLLDEAHSTLRLSTTVDLARLLVFRPAPTVGLAAQRAGNRGAATSYDTPRGQTRRNRSLAA